MSKDEPSLSNELSILRTPPRRDEFASALEAKIHEAGFAGSGARNAAGVIPFPIKKVVLFLSAAALFVGGGAWAYRASQPSEARTKQEPSPFVEASPVVEPSAPPANPANLTGDVPPVTDAADVPDESAALNVLTAPPEQAPITRSAPPRHADASKPSAASTSSPDVSKTLQVELAVPSLKRSKPSPSAGQLQRLERSTPSGAAVGKKRDPIRRPGEVRE
jgi:hypothetical protein